MTKPHLAEVVSLYDSNIRDPAATLRKIADRIDDGEYGSVVCVSVALLGDTLEVFGAGPDSEAPTAAMVLHAGFMKLSRAMMDRGE